jgi:hypothetical protein
MTAAVAAVVSEEEQTAHRVTKKGPVVKKVTDDDA